MEEIKLPKPYLICGPEQHEFGKILEDILNEMGFSFSMIDVGSVQHPVLVPDIRSPGNFKIQGYEVVGMGKCQNISDRFYSL